MLISAESRPIIENSH